MTADRRGGVPPLLQSAVAARIVLRQADESGYGDHGVPLGRARSLDLAPGRGLWQATELVQLACVADSGDGPSQAAAIGLAAAAMPDREPALTTAPLPDAVAVPAYRRRAGELVLGVADLTLAPVVVDVRHSNLLVAGLPRSGRSTVAALLATQLDLAGADLWLVGPSASPLAHLGGGGRGAFGRPDALLPLLDELATVVDSFQTADPHVLVVDDLDALDDPALNLLWERLARADGLRVIATIESRNHAGFSMNAMLNEMRKARRSLFLQPDDAVEFFQQTGVKPPIRPGTPMPPGRGVLLVDRSPILVQVADPAARTSMPAQAI
jgi:S-DNA-T family DNA segregation ATPase FtsK/SpoIIIE